MLAAMPGQAPITYHADLLRYWEARRAGRAMPARRDLEPGDLRTLLPYLTLIDHPDGQFRYRLVGTAVSQELGRDMTGQSVGSYISPPEYAAALMAIYERVFTTARPVFTTGEYRSATRAIHAISRLLLPLSEDGASVNMVVLTRISRFSRSVTAGVDWLKGAPGKVCDVVDVDRIEEVEALSREWERQTSIEYTAA
jgi:hypothetical protein